VAAPLESAIESRTPESFRIDGVTVQAEGTGPEVLLMLHGWPDTHRLWDAQVAAFAARFRCVRFTLPGFEPSTPPDPASLDRIVELLHRVSLRTSPDRPVTLLLHDWGCLFGYQFAMRHPQRVARIVGVDVGDAGSGAHLRSLGVKAKASIAIYQLWLALAWRLGGRLGDRMARGMAKALRCPAEPSRIHAGMGYPYDIQWTGSHGSYRHGLPFDPPCPMLYLYGARKPFHFHSAEWAQALARWPGSRVLPMHTGHWVMCQEPQAFNAAVASWLEATHAG
jgi:pimeloyl-ACP methyl ester carboxylesterase